MDNVFYIQAFWKSQHTLFKLKLELEPFDLAQSAFGRSDSTHSYRPTFRARGLML